MKLRLSDYDNFQEVTAKSDKFYDKIVEMYSDQFGQNLEDIEDVDDGVHTFKELYLQRAVLFATIIKLCKDYYSCWKSWKHEDGEPCFGGGWFIVGIDTPEGQYTYHYSDPYWDLFDCEELDVGKHCDGHSWMDVGRLLSLE